MADSSNGVLERRALLIPLGMAKDDRMCEKTDEYSDVDVDAEVGSDIDIGIDNQEERMNEEEEDT